MADKGSNDTRRLTFIGNTTDFNKDIPEIKGWEVWNREDENIGKVDALIGDVTDQSLRYVDIHLKEEQRTKRNDPNEKKNLSLPVGLGKLDQENQRLILDRVDPDLMQAVPLHEEGQLINYELEMKIRAIFEQADQTDLKSGVNQPPGPDSIKEKQGESINEKIIDPEGGHKRDKDINERRVADELQGEYTPNLTGDAEGIKKRAINPEGKHDISATSGNPESTNKSGVSNELSSAAAPGSTEVPSTDSPGETLGRAEVDNKYRDPENKNLPQPHGPPENPLNASDDFYRHEMFNGQHLVG